MAHHSTFHKPNRTGALSPSLPLVPHLYERLDAVTVVVDTGVATHRRRYV
jgi:hypothetical protein